MARRYVLNDIELMHGDLTELIPRMLEEAGGKQHIVAQKLKCSQATISHWLSRNNYIAITQWVKKDVPSDIHPKGKNMKRPFIFESRVKPSDNRPYTSWSRVGNPFATLESAHSKVGRLKKILEGGDFEYEYRIRNLETRQIVWDSESKSQ